MDPVTEKQVKEIVADALESVARNIQTDGFSAYQERDYADEFKRALDSEVMRLRYSDST